MLKFKFVSSRLQTSLKRSFLPTTVAFSNDQFAVQQRLFDLFAAHYQNMIKPAKSALICGKVHNSKTSTFQKFSLVIGNYDVDIKGGRY